MNRRSFFRSLSVAWWAPMPRKPKRAKAEAQE